MKSIPRITVHRRRGAILSMELILVLPLFLLLLFAIVEFTMLTAAQTRIANAAHAGARQLCLTNAPAETVRKDVIQSLGSRLGGGATVEVTDPGKAGDRINIRVNVPMQNAAPDLLWMTGFSVRNRVMAADALMVREHDTVSAGQTQL